MGVPGRFRKKLGPDDEQTLMAYAKRYLAGAPLAGSIATSRNNRKSKLLALRHTPD